MRKMVLTVIYFRVIKEREGDRGARRVRNSIGIISTKSCAKSLYKVANWKFAQCKNTLQ